VQELRADGKTVDIVMRTASLPPAEDWYRVEELA
jgi:hypothetical protein